MPDEHGKIRSLKEFRGKTVFIHFWFTGCPACITLAKELSPTIEKLKSNEKVWDVCKLTIYVAFQETKLIASFMRYKHDSNQGIRMFANMNRVWDAMKPFVYQQMPPSHFKIFKQC